jgi:hypothetical protein
MQILLAPFKLLWNLLALILNLTGRLLAAVLGLVLMIVGGIVTVTVVGAVVGIPLMIVGFALLMRSLF